MPYYTYSKAVENLRVASHPTVASRSKQQSNYHPTIVNTMAGKASSMDERNDTSDHYANGASQSSADSLDRKNGLISAKFFDFAMGKSEL